MYVPPWWCWLLRVRLAEPSPCMLMCAPMAAYWGCNYSGQRTASTKLGSCPEGHEK